MVESSGQVIPETGEKNGYFVLRLDSESKTILNVCQDELTQY